MKQLTNLLLTVLLIAACNNPQDPDPDLVAQAVAATLAAQPTAPAAPTSQPTSTPIPTATPSPTRRSTPTSTSTPTPALVKCLDQPDVQAWLSMVEGTVDEWNFETEILVRTPRISAAQASREVKDIVRRLRQQVTPDCAVQMRDQLLMRMRSLITSVDNFIDESGGVWFAIGYKIDLEEFVAYLPDQTGEQLVRCKSKVSDSWVDTTEAYIAFWSISAFLPNEADNKESLSEARSNIIANPSLDCAKASIAEATTKVLDRILENYEIQASSSANGLALETESMTSVFRAIVDEYSMLHPSN